MSRKVAWSILLLLLTSVQSFALTCNVRCVLMATPAKAASADSSMRAMEHCDMPTASVQNGPMAQSMQALQLRSSNTCCNDLSFAKDPGTAEQIDISPHTFDSASISESAIAAPLQKHDRRPAYASTIQPSGLTPLISNLRV